MPLTGQSKVGDLQRLVAEVFHLHPLKDEDWSSEEGGDERIFLFWLEMGGRGNIRQGGHADRPQIKRFHVFVTGIEMMEEQQQEDQNHDKI